MMTQTDALNGLRLSSEDEVPGDLRDFRTAYTRACSGTERDVKFLAHFAACKDAGLHTGLYLQFRQTRRPELQVQVFNDAAKVLGYGPGDLWPTLALDDHELTDGPLNEEIYNIGGKITADSLAATYGGCVIKLSHEVWEKMLKPAWIFRFPIWLEESSKSRGVFDIGRPVAIRGYSWGDRAGLVWSGSSLPLIPLPPVVASRQDAFDQAMEDFASGLEMIAVGLRKLAGWRDAGGGDGGGSGGSSCGHDH